MAERNGEFRRYGDDELKLVGMTDRGDSPEAGRFPYPGSGMGRLTLREYSEWFDLELEGILSVLAARGLEIDPDEQLREAASGLGTTPVGIFEVLNRR